MEPLVITIIVVVISVGSIAMFIPMMLRAGKLMGSAQQFMDSNSQTMQLRARGIPAAARVLRVTPTGRLINMQLHECHIELDVFPSSAEGYRGPQPPYRVATIQCLHAVVFPRVQPGLDVRVKVDPLNPYNVAIDV